MESEKFRSSEPNVENNWRNRAACRQGLPNSPDPELFFPAGVSRAYEGQIEEAKAYCGRCAVSSECLTESIKRRCEEGIWGGLTEDERRSIKRKQQRIQRARRSA